MSHQRRSFVIHALGGSALLLGAGLARSARAEVSAHAGAILSESDPQAQSRNYVADAGKVERKKFPRFVPGQQCSACAMYQGRPHEEHGNCPLFGDRHVAAHGWCSAFFAKSP